MTAPISQGFLVDEDNAIKARMAGMVVSDNARPARPVPVWFGQPDLAREQSFPFVTIDLINIEEASDRAHRGIIPVDPVTAADTTTPVVYQDWPIPVNLYYQIQTWSRQPRHDRAMLAQIYEVLLPFKYGLLAVEGDGTYRYMTLVSFRKADRTDENNKRLFRNIFTVQVHSELPANQYGAVKKVTNVSNVLIGERIRQTFTPPTDSSPAY